MDYWLLMIAAIISLGGMVLHGFVGGRIYIGNINSSDMNPLTKSLSLVSWHVFTVFLLGCAVALIYVAATPGAEPVAYPVIGINLMGAALFVVLGFGGHAHLLRLPGAYLMGATGILAWLAIS